MPSARSLQSPQKTKTAKPIAQPAARRAPQSRSGSPAQLLQLQRQYGNQAVQQSIQREAVRQPGGVQAQVGQPTIQRAGPVYKQPNEVLGVTSDPKVTNETPADERDRQVTRLIEHAVLASTDFKTMLTGIIDQVNADIPGGCVNGDPGFAHVTKELQSALDKAGGRMTGESVADMKDVLRGTIKCKSVQALERAQELLTARAAALALREVSVGGTQKKDGFARRAGDMTGYGDIKFLTPILHGIFDTPGPNGEPPRPDFWMYAEIQLMTDDMNAKKMEGGGHVYYDLTRDIKEYAQPKPGGLTHYLEPKPAIVDATRKLLGEHYETIERGVNTPQMNTLVPKLIKLAMRERIELTQQEVAGLELAGELIYRRERLEGNFMRQGIHAGEMRGDWAESKPTTQGWGGTPVRPRRADNLGR